MFISNKYFLKKRLINLYFSLFSTKYSNVLFYMIQHYSFLDDMKRCLFKFTIFAVLSHPTNKNGIISTGHDVNIIICRNSNVQRLINSNKNVENLSEVIQTRGKL